MDDAFETRERTTTSNFKWFILILNLGGVFTLSISKRSGYMVVIIVVLYVMYMNADHKGLMIHKGSTKLISHKGSGPQGIKTSLTVLAKLKCSSCHDPLHNWL